MKKHSGFTLLELMIVVAIIGILAAIAYPSFQDSITKSRRADAMATLVGFQGAMERFYTANNTYVGAASGAVATGSPTIYSAVSPVDGGNVFYNLTINAASTATFTLRATPINAQSNDGILEIENTDARGWDQDNSGTIADPAEKNWND